VAIHVGPRLVRRAALHGLGGLAELQVEAGAETAALVHGRHALDDHVRLLNAKHVGTRVVRAEQVDPVVRGVPVVLIEAFKPDAKDDVFKRTRLLEWSRAGRRLLSGRGRRAQNHASDEQTDEVHDARLLFPQ
jgi:hypothetical protein